MHFVMENPMQSEAWRLPELRALRQDPRVRAVVVDQCEFGLRPQDGSDRYHKKPTRLLTSSQALVSEMTGRRCKGLHEHAPCMGGVRITEPAGHYPKAFASAMVKSLENQFDFKTKQLVAGLEDDGFVNETLAAEAKDSDVDAPESDSEDELIADQDTVDGKKVVISAAVKNAVYRLHENTGHRSGRRLARALLVCGAPREAVLAAKKLQCSVCRERQPPKARRPASLPVPRQVGEQAHIDLVIIEDAADVCGVPHHGLGVSLPDGGSAGVEGDPSGGGVFADPMDTVDGPAKDISCRPRT